MPDLTDDQKREKRNAYQREYMKKRRAAMTPEEHELHKEQWREYQREYKRRKRAEQRARMTPEEIEQERAHRREYYAVWRAKNIDWAREYAREASRKARAQNPEKSREASRRWYQRKALEDPHYQAKLKAKQRATPDGRAKAIASQRRFHKRLALWMQNYKLQLGCADCGYKGHHAALEFDHVLSGKRLNVGECRSYAKAKSEIALCEVVCANCHRIRTWRRRQKGGQSHSDGFSVTRATEDGGARG